MIEFVSFGASKMSVVFRGTSPGVASSRATRWKGSCLGALYSDFELSLMATSGLVWAWACWAAGKQNHPCWPNLALTPPLPRPAGRVRPPVPQTLLGAGGAERPDSAGQLSLCWRGGGHLLLAAAGARDGGGCRMLQTEQRPGSAAAGKAP